MIRAVTFDFWGTLYSEGEPPSRRVGLRAEYAQGFLMGKGHDVALDKVRCALELVYHQVENMRKVEHMGAPADEVGQRIGQVLGIGLGEQEERELGELVSSACIECPPLPMAGARDVLGALRGKVKTAIISDTGLTLGRHLYQVMEQDGFAQLVDTFTFSDQTGTTKPMTRQFLHTLFRLDCQPEQAVHVGDLEESDVAGAHEAGMRAIRILRPGHDPKTLADAAVEDIRDVLDVLRNWGLAL